MLVTDLHGDTLGLIQRFSDLLESDAERLRRWMFARAAAEPRPDWSDAVWNDIARALADKST